MGRKKIEINPLKIYELSLRGMTQKEMAKELGVSHVTLAKRMAEIQREKGLLLKYRSLQTLELTLLQWRILEAVTTEKIESASLLELVKAFGILKKAELGMEEERPKIKGLLGYLVALERKELEESDD